MCLQSLVYTGSSDWYHIINYIKCHIPHKGVITYTYMQLIYILTKTLYTTRHYLVTGAVDTSIIIMCSWINIAWQYALNNYNSVIVLLVLCVIVIILIIQIRYYSHYWHTSSKVYANSNIFFETAKKDPVKMSSMKTLLQSKMILRQGIKLKWIHQRMERYWTIHFNYNS